MQGAVPQSEAVQWGVELSRSAHVAQLADLEFLILINLHIPTHSHDHPNSAYCGFVNTSRRLHDIAAFCKSGIQDLICYLQPDRAFGCVPMQSSLDGH